MHWDVYTADAQNPGASVVNLTVHVMLVLFVDFHTMHCTRNTKTGTYFGISYAYSIQVL